MAIEPISRYHKRQKAMFERHERRAQKGRVRLERMPEETAQEYIDHYAEYGIEHFTPEHCPEKFRPEVLAHFRRAA